MICPSRARNRSRRFRPIDPSAGHPKLRGVGERSLETRIAEARSQLVDRAPAGLERRLVPARFVETRDAEEGEGYELRGYAAVFDSLSEDLGGFREIIKRGAFKGPLKNGDDVRLLVNHNPDLLLARTASGTLKLKEDPVGLLTDADVADTQTGRDLRVLVDRGDLNQMSFAFRVLEDEWDVDDEDNLIRTITKVWELFDVSAVTYPAYPDTTLEQPRSTIPNLSPTTPERTPQADAQERGAQAGEVTGAGDEDTAPALTGVERSIRLRERKLRLAA